MPPELIQPGEARPSELVLHLIRTTLTLIGCDYLTGCSLKLANSAYPDKEVSAGALGQDGGTCPAGDGRRSEGRQQRQPWDDRAND